jgi:Holliday junction DNA helicase RuvA
VGPKSAFNLLTSLGHEQIVQSIQFENKKILTKAPGIGAKAAAQICLDLGSKIQKVLMYSATPGQTIVHATDTNFQLEQQSEVSTVVSDSTHHSGLLNDALMACKELGFKEESVLPLAKKILLETQVLKPEQLIHLVLKEM